MPEGRAWKNVNEQEDWLRTKGKILAYITQVLANRLRSEFPSLPAQVVHLVYGYITPVAAEYVRRAIWRETTLSLYEKAQLHIFTLRMYAYVISQYKGSLPNAEQCMDELLDVPIPLVDKSFATRMHRVTPIFDEYFRLYARDQDEDIEHDTVFTGAFLRQIGEIVNERAGAALPVMEQDLTRMLEVFFTTGWTVRKMLAD